MAAVILDANQDDIINSALAKDKKMGDLELSHAPHRAWGPQYNSNKTYKTIIKLLNQLELLV